MRALVLKAEAAPAAGAPAPAARTDINAVSKRVIMALDGVDLPTPIRITIEGERDPATIGKASPETEAILVKHLPVFKTDEERFVLGIVLEPTKEMGQPDSQKDVYSAEEVKKSSYKFMEEFQVIGLQHRADVSDRVSILLNWITLEDSTINGQPVTKGTWLLGVRVKDDTLWAAVKSGEITGFSIGGVASRTPVSIDPAATSPAPSYAAA